MRYKTVGEFLKNEGRCDLHLIIFEVCHNTYSLYFDGKISYGLPEAIKRKPLLDWMRDRDRAVLYVEKG